MRSKCQTKRCQYSERSLVTPSCFLNQPIPVTPCSTTQKHQSGHKTGAGNSRSSPADILAARQRTECRRSQGRVQLCDREIPSRLLVLHQRKPSYMMYARSRAVGLHVAQAKTTVWNVRSTSLERKLLGTQHHCSFAAFSEKKKKHPVHAHLPKITLAEKFHGFGRPPF